jgi:dolichol-phosphate mannosyltransferase
MPTYPDILTKWRGTFHFDRVPAARTGLHRQSGQTILVRTNRCPARHRQEDTPAVTADNEQHKLRASFVIPAHNEEQNITTTVEGLRQMAREHGIPHEIIVVNDNSTDGTPEVIRALMAEDPAIRTVDRTPPGGFGRALRSGLELVTGDLVIIYMADQSDDPADALAYYRKIEEGYDCVFGSRFRRGSTVRHYPWLKLVINRLVNRCIQAMFFCRFNDLTNAFKAYRTEVLRECGPFRASHFNITLEMSLSALVHRYNITEIPISWHGRTWGSSNLRLSVMGRRYLQVLLKLFFERMLISDDVMAERLAHQARRMDTMAALRGRVEQLEGRVAALEQAEGRNTAAEGRAEDTNP